MNNLRSMDESLKNSYINKYGDECDKVALHLAFKYHIDIEEMKSEAYYILSTCIDNFDEDIGTPFKTYLHSALNTGLRRFITNNEEMKDVFTINYNKKHHGEQRV